MEIKKVVHMSDYEEVIKDPVARIYMENAVKKAVAVLFKCAKRCPWLDIFDLIMATTGVMQVIAFDAKEKWEEELKNENAN